jgi:hypothetical protein
MNFHVCPLQDYSYRDPPAGTVRLSAVRRPTDEG